jgi:hypothetical protein
MSEGQQAGLGSPIPPLPPRAQEEELSRMIQEQQAEIERLRAAAATGAGTILVQDDQQQQEQRQPAMTTQCQLPNKTILIGRMAVQVKQTATVLTPEDEVLYHKEDCAQLIEEKKVEFFDKITKQAHRQFDLVPLTLTNKSKLDDTYNLDMLVRKTRQVHTMYDMHDVFRIFMLDTDGVTVIGEKNLYTEYATITMQQVAKSNKWYCTWPVDTTFAENLKLTYRSLQNNTSNQLYNKVFETYDKYPAEEQGGLLFFIITINQLQSNSEEAAKSLVVQVRSIWLDNLAGKNVDKAVSYLSGAMNRLKHINKLPVDFVNMLICIMQTSSVESFNSTFSYLEKACAIDLALLETGQTTQISADKVLELAAAEYCKLCEKGEWTGAGNKGKSAFIASGIQAKVRIAVCWNCGGAHKLDECKKSKDEKKIQAAKDKYQAD